MMIDLGDFAVDIPCSYKNVLIKVKNTKWTCILGGTSSF